MSWRQYAQSLRQETTALYLAARHPRTPWYAKVLALCIVAYALSPIDLIPDPIPILGLLDDLILIPLGILLLRRLIPQDVLAECRQSARDALGRPATRLGRIAAGIIILLWMAALFAIAYALYAIFFRTR